MDEEDTKSKSHLRTERKSEDDCDRASKDRRRRSRSRDRDRDKRRRSRSRERRRDRSRSLSRERRHRSRDRDDDSRNKRRHSGSSSDKRKRGRNSHADNSSQQNHSRYSIQSSNASLEINIQKKSDVQGFVPQPQPAPTPKLPLYMNIMPFPPPIQFSSHQFSGFDGNNESKSNTSSSMYQHVPYFMPTPTSSFVLPPPPPPPSDEFLMEPPPPPPELPPPDLPSSSNGIDDKIRRFDSKAISTAMKSRPIIFKRSDIPSLPSNWGTMSVDAYSIIVQVGEGTYGHVYKAKRKDGTGDLVALKKVRLENEREGFPITAVREIKLLRRLCHKNIVRLLDVITESSCHGSKKDITAFFLVFEYVDHDLNGLLESGLVEFTQDQTASLFKQLLLALQHCHSKDLLHRDLKCANILINNKGELKLGDLGLARIYSKNSDRLYTNRVITLWYRPPELLLGEEKYGPAIDIWSAGCILGELFTKKPIFQGHNEQQQLDLISQFCGTPSTDVWPNVINLPLYVNMRFRNYYIRSIRTKFSQFPAPALDLFDLLLALDPDKRPSATKALEHSWLRKIDPSRVPPPNLPKNQDCHERWAKTQRNEQQRNRRSTTALNVNSRDSAVAF